MITRVYTVPLKKAWRRKKNRRAEAAMRFLRAFISRHMKTAPEKVKIDAKVNEKIWERSMNNPPRRIRVTATKADDGTVIVSLFTEGARKEEKAERKVEEKKKIEKKGKKEVEEKRGEEKAGKKEEKEEKKEVKRTRKKEKEEAGKEKVEGKKEEKKGKKRKTKEEKEDAGAEEKSHEES